MSIVTDSVLRFAESDATTDNFVYAFSLNKNFIARIGTDVDDRDVEYFYFEGESIKALGYLDTLVWCVSNGAIKIITGLDNNDIKIETFEESDIEHLYEALVPYKGKMYVLENNTTSHKVQILNLSDKTTVFSFGGGDVFYGGIDMAIDRTTGQKYITTSQDILVVTGYDTMNVINTDTEDSRKDPDYRNTKEQPLQISANNGVAYFTTNYNNINILYKGNISKSYFGKARLADVTFVTYPQLQAAYPYPASQLWISSNPNPRVSQISTGIIRVAYPVLACPGACSGHGECNFLTSKCTCAAGYAGADCSTKPPRCVLR